MNVEVCTTVRGVKYIFKYIHKGNDAHYVGPHQAVFRIMQYKMHDKSHIIIRLAIHLPLQQNVHFQNGNEQQALQRHEQTMLIAFSRLNQLDQNAHQYLYHEIPEHHTFNKSAKKWNPRQRASAPIIG